MPLQICTLDGKDGWKFGESGKCYTYEKGDEVGERYAKKNAIAQGKAMGEYQKEERICKIRSFKKMQDRPVLSIHQVSAAKKHFDALEFEDMSDYEIVREITDITPYIKEDGDLDEDAMMEGYFSFLNTGAINPRPEEESFMDKKTVKVRYKYTGPQDSRNREFCAYMMASFSMDYFRREDINQMSFSSVNNAFGTYSIWNYKGSFNCRHSWSAFIFRLKKGEDISDAQSVTKSAADSSLENPRVKQK